MLVSEAKNYDTAKHNSIIIWHIDGGGRPISRTMPLAIDNLADELPGAIEMDLHTHHELSTSSVAEVRSSLVDSLKKADTKNRVSNVTILAGSFPDFCSKVLSSDGKSFVHLEHNDSAEEVRLPGKFPQVMIRSFTYPKTEIGRLLGHENAMMWASFSPTDPNVFATAA